ncbi:hypothetical protein ISS06_00495 [Patescibacteria group bacterium]|nr:hypothetical protein [Patescibacteria group bacterium]
MFLKKAKKVKVLIGKLISKSKQPKKIKITIFSSGILGLIALVLIVGMYSRMTTEQNVINNRIDKLVLEIKELKNRTITSSQKIFREPATIIVDKNGLWVVDPADCPYFDLSIFPGQNCKPNQICGKSNKIAQCYNMNKLIPPKSIAISNKNWADFLYDNKLANGGFLINCYAPIDNNAPFCDNNEKFWCDRSDFCYDQQKRETICLPGGWGKFKCGDCLDGYEDKFASDICEIKEK